MGFDQRKCLSGPRTRAASDCAGLDRVRHNGMVQCLAAPRKSSRRGLLPTDGGRSLGEFVDFDQRDACGAGDASEVGGVVAGGEGDDQRRVVGTGGKGKRSD